MCLFVEIAMLLFGGAVLIKGTLKLTRRRIVSGIPARFIGLLMMVPLPFNLGSIFMISTAARRQEALVGLMIASELIVTLSVPVLCLLLAVVFSKKVLRQPAEEQPFSPNAANVIPRDPDNPYAPSGTSPGPKR
jgi:hypothetical protein